MSKFSLLEMARVDLQTTMEKLEKYSFEDELHINIAAFHLQQAVEKGLKYLMELNSIKFEWTHDISKLCGKLKDNEVNFPKWIHEEARTLTDLASIRYPDKGIKTSKSYLNGLMPEVQAFLASMNVKEKKTDVLEALKKLEEMNGSCFPK